MRLRLAVTAAMLLAAGCGGGEETRRVEHPRLPFTFELPDDFEQRRVQPGFSQGTPPIVAYALDPLNLVDVRRSAPRALPLGTVERQIAESLVGLGFPPPRPRREEHSGRPMVVFDLANRIGGAATRSRLYFFTGAGGTWEIECQSTVGRRDAVDAACEGAVDSLEFEE